MTMSIHRRIPCTIFLSLVLQAREGYRWNRHHLMHLIGPLRKEGNCQNQITLDQKNIRILTVEYFRLPHSTSAKEESAFLAQRGRLSMSIHRCIPCTIFLSLVLQAREGYRWNRHHLMHLIGPLRKEGNCQNQITLDQKNIRILTVEYF